MNLRDTNVAPILTVVCPRLNVARTVEQHVSCPYCWGKRAEVETSGDRKCFCDFQPGVDPIVFGFPEGTSRIRG